MTPKTLLVAVVALLSTACGPTNPRCSSTNCLGCCDSVGLCRPGRDLTACGSNAEACSICPLGSGCQAGSCQLETPAGGAGGGSSGGLAGGVAGGLSGGGFAAGGVAGGLGGGSAGTTEWNTYCQRFTQAFTDFLVRCGATTTRGAEEQARAIDSFCRDGERAVAQRRARLNPVAGQRCLTAISTAACTLHNSRIPFADCAAAFEGLVAPGGACFSSGGSFGNFKASECVRDFSCNTSTTCPGRCVRQVSLGQRPGPGESCFDDAYAYNGRCTAYATTGSSCAPTAGATSEQSCTGPDICLNGTCIPYALNNRTQGMTCSDFRDCLLGLSCVSNICTALIDVNGACSPNATTPTCKLDLGCTPGGVCARDSMMGGPCSDDLRCVSGLYCARGLDDFGVCRLPQSNGQSCANPLQCQSDSYCSETRICQAKRSLGAPCGDDFSECQAGLYCTTSTPRTCAAQKPFGASCSGFGNECRVGSSCVQGVCRASSCDDSL